jgi:hypothetical protein
MVNKGKSSSSLPEVLADKAKKLIASIQPPPSGTTPESVFEIYKQQTRGLNAKLNYAEPKNRILLETRLNKPSLQAAINQLGFDQGIRFFKQLSLVTLQSKLTECAALLTDKDPTASAIRNKLAKDTLYPKWLDLETLAASGYYQFIKMGYAEDIERALLKYAQANQIRSTLPSDSAANCFTKLGEIWFIQFKNRAFFLKDRKGLGYIYELLKAPKREIWVGDLIAQSQNPIPAHNEDAIMAGIHGEPDAEYESVSKRKQSASFDAEISHLRKINTRIREIDAELDDDSTDLGKTSKLRKEKGLLLAEVTEIKNSKRPVGTQKRNQQSVRMEITRALKTILKFDPDLERHLRNCIQTGTRCMYAPSNPINWKT